MKTIKYNTIVISITESDPSLPLTAVRRFILNDKLNSLRRPQISRVKKPVLNYAQRLPNLYIPLFQQEELLLNEIETQTRCSWTR